MKPVPKRPEVAPALPPGRAPAAALRARAARKNSSPNMKTNNNNPTKREGIENGTAVASNGRSAKHTASNGRSAKHTGGDFMMELVTALDRVREGDFSTRVPSGYVGIEGRGAEGVNLVVSRLQRFNHNLARLRRQVGDEGRISERLAIGDAVGSWAERIEAINAILDDLSQPNVEMGRVIG